LLESAKISSTCHTIAYFLDNVRKALTEVSELMHKGNKNESGFDASSLFEMNFFWTSH
jgi:hypothetical protein